MKKVGLILILVAMFLSAKGQDQLLDLPYFPSHTLEHIKVKRTYSVDTLTGERKLIHTERYDRHGFSADTSCRNVYDERGRLIMQETYHWISSSSNPMPRREISWRCSIEYNSDGAVKYVKHESFGKYCEGVTEYFLVSHKEHPLSSLTECVYSIGWGEGYQDTLRFSREYDADGHLLHEYCSDEGSGYRDKNFFYDASGRIVASRTYYYESWDTLDYNYDVNGALISQTGKLYELDMEADVTISFRPNGTRRERKEHWIVYSDPTQESDELFLYDEHDVLVYEKTPRGILEYEIEYWE